MEAAVRDGILLGRHATLFVALALSVYTDLAHGRIPNWLSYPAIGLGLAAAYLLGGTGWGEPLTFAPHDPHPTLAGALAGAAAGGGALALLYAAGGMGGGDVKLMAAVGTLMGLGFSLHALFFTSVAGAVLALAVLARRERLADGLRGVPRLLWPWRDRSRDPERITLPYGAAIAAGTMWAWWRIYG